jgi:hypothetical protein
MVGDGWADVEPSISLDNPSAHKHRFTFPETVRKLTYFLNSDYQWRGIAKDPPPRGTVRNYFDRWSDDGTLDD